MYLRSCSISRRAFICFGLIAALVVGLGVFAYVQLGHLRAAEQAIEGNSLPSIEAIDDIEIALLHARLESVRMLAWNDPTQRGASLTKIREAISTIQSRSEYYRANLISGETDRIQFAEANVRMQSYLEGLQTLLALDTTDHEQAVLLVNGDQAIRAEAYQTQLTKLRNQNGLDADNSGDFATSEYSKSVNVLVAVVIVALILTVFLAIALTRSIVEPIGASLKLAQGIASGDLTQQLVITGNDEAAHLMRALNQMSANLCTTVREISNASGLLNTAADEMAKITHIADRTLQQQNSEIEQAATAVNEMSVAVEEVARNATSTSEAALQSSDFARQGNVRVSETVTAMRGLTELVEGSSAQVVTLAEQAQDISKVLVVIRGVAEQTNLLALNAAIEAARAGEQGRGFAVVADEVRALAHRTQISTQDIEQMITAIQSGSALTVESMKRSTQEVHNALETAEQAGQSLRSITQAVVEINDRNLQIATASEEQAHVARDVDRSLSSIRDLALESTEGARQTLGASNQLSQLALNLNSMVLRFKV